MKPGLGSKAVGSQLLKRTVPRGASLARLPGLVEQPVYRFDTLMAGSLQQYTHRQWRRTLSYTTMIVLAPVCQGISTPQTRQRLIIGSQ